MVAGQLGGLNHDLHADTTVLFKLLNMRFDVLLLLSDDHLNIFFLKLDLFFVLLRLCDLLGLTFGLLVLILG